MRVAKHGEEDASHAITYYAVVDNAAQKLAWLSLKPVTGRTHQLRAQLAHIGHPIVGDDNISISRTGNCPAAFRTSCICWRGDLHPASERQGTIELPRHLPPHMQQTLEPVGLDAERYDPIEDAPEE